MEEVFKILQNHELPNPAAPKFRENEKEKKPTGGLIFGVLTFRHAIVCLYPFLG